MQSRKAWCRGCGGEGSYSTGWCVLEVSDFEALQNAVRAPIQSQRGLDPGRVLVRLRVRHLRCVHCRERGLLVAGATPLVLTPDRAARAR